MPNLYVGISGKTTNYSLVSNILSFLISVISMPPIRILFGAWPPDQHFLAYLVAEYSPETKSKSEGVSINYCVYIVCNFYLISRKAFFPGLSFFPFLQKVKKAGATFSHVSKNHSHKASRIKQWKKSWVTYWLHSTATWPAGLYLLGKRNKALYYSCLFTFGSYVLLLERVCLHNN